MATIIGGLASSHTPLMSLPGDLWESFAVRDPKNRELISPGKGEHVTWDQLLAQADPNIAKVIGKEHFERRVANIQAGLDSLNRTFGQLDPDAVVMFGDDQNELFYFDNYPTINVYWGDTLRMVPRQLPADAPLASRLVAASYGPMEGVIDYPVKSDLALHIIESLMERDFDVAHSRYLNSEYGGKIGPSTWYLNFEVPTKPRPQGMGHAFAYPILRWFGGKRVPIVPISINTCYPPNWISPRRAFALGRAVREAILSWPSDARVAIAASGGLSHFVVDEDLDRRVLKALCESDGDVLSNLPRNRLQSATTETLNWVAVGGAMGDTPMEVVTYEPSFRTVAGTGVGIGCGRWLP